MKIFHRRIVTALVASIVVCASASADVTVGGTQATCAEDPGCINRFHADIPMAARAKPGEKIHMIGRDAGDVHLDPDEFSAAESSPRAGFGVVHPLVGPVFIEGAQIGDVLAVTIEEINPGPVGWTSASPFGFAGDYVGSESRFIVWRLSDEFATSDALPGVRIPNASFPGVIATLPGQQQLVQILEREQALADAGGAAVRHRRYEIRRMSAHNSAA
jgi:formamidase